MRRITQVEDFNRAVKLAKLGARPPIIRDLCKTIGIQESLRIYTEAVGSSPPPGPLPSRHETLFETQRLRWQGSVLAVAFRRLEPAVPRFADGYVAAYEHAQAVFQEEEFLYTFDRAWLLIRRTAMGHIKLLTCSVCGSEYVHNAAELVNHTRNCPVCVVLRRAHRPVQVAKRVPAANDERIDIFVA